VEVLLDIVHVGLTSDEALAKAKWVAAAGRRATAPSLAVGYCSG
jgi:hypothetical protein